MRKIKRYVNKESVDPIPPEPQVKRFPIHVDKRTTIFVKEGCNIELHVQRFRERQVTVPGFIPWD